MPLDIADWLARHPAPSPQKRPRSFELNYSRLRAYLDCPWLYKIRFLDGRPQPPSPESSLGMSLHKALELYHKKGDAALERLLELYDRHFHRDGFRDDEERKAWRKKGEAILKRYWKADSERRHEVAYVEREFLFELGPHRVRGMIDRIDRRPDGSFELIDYKTREPEGGEGSAELQLKLYGLGAREGLGIEPAALTVLYLSSGERRGVSWDPAEEEPLKVLLARAAELMAAAEYRPETSFCARCAFNAICPHSTKR